jgi:integrase
MVLYRDRCRSVSIETIGLFDSLAVHFFHTRTLYNMVERATPNPEPESKKAQANTVKLTKTVIDKLDHPSAGQRIVWDTEQKGLSVLVSASVKSFRATYKLGGRTVTTVIGRVGELGLDDARDTCGQYRRDARRGIDPKGPKPGTLTYEQVVDRYITVYAKVNQRTWYQTEGSLKSFGKLLKRPSDAITRKDVTDILDDWAITDGLPYKASNALSHVKHMWAWAVTKGIVETSILRDVKSQYEKRKRKRVFTDDEIKSIWQACDRLANPAEGAYFKLLLLLAPRVSALAFMRRSHLDNPDNPTLWTTPFELTKSRKTKANDDEPRVYQTPLSGLAKRVLKPLLPTGADPDALVFPSLPLGRTKDDGFEFHTSRPVHRLKQAGAPKDFFPHAIRHTVSSWMRDRGASLWERGLVLNHAESGVTAGYSHETIGITPKAKLDWLEAWADHIEQLVSPAQNVAVLR